MATPNIDLDLYMPKTYVFERKNKGYNEVASMTQQNNEGFFYVNLPRGMSAVTITASAFQGGSLRVVLDGPNYAEHLTDWISTYDPVVRLWSGTVSSPGSNWSEGGLRIRIEAKLVTTSGMDTGSASVQIVNFPPEN